MIRNYLHLVYVIIVSSKGGVDLSWIMMWRLANCTTSMVKCLKINKLSLIKENVKDFLREYVDKFGREDTEKII